MKIQDFKNAVSKGGGLVPANRFYVFFVTPDSVQTSFGFERQLCTSVSLPNLNITTTTAFPDGLEFDFATNSTVENVTLRFRETNNMVISRFLEDWSSKIVNREKRVLGYPEDYLGAMVIEVHNGDSNDIPVLVLEMNRVFPMSVSYTDLSDDNSNSIMEITSTFSVREVKRVQPLRNDLSQIQRSTRRDGRTLRDFFG